MIAGSATRAQVKIEGTVQGVGFRPFVFRIARELDLTGWIVNGTDGVTIEVEGAAEAVGRLLERIQAVCPPGAKIERMSVRPIPAVGDSEFTIQPACEGGTKQLAMAPDLATCVDCVEELFDPLDRRFRYPWLSCTQCGPRFSMVTGVPYDRANTTMSRFVLCEACRVEYEAPENRRFHAESTACPACGPKLALWDVDGQVSAEGEEALQRTCRIIRTGGIVAVKGIGGFHVWVDAASEEAVQLLRARKRRAHKPFAVMFPSLETIRMTCTLLPGEAEWLTSPEAPIVILQRLEQTSLAQGVAPGNPTVGAMLPYTPLHHLLMRKLGTPVVSTSGNRSEEPIVTDEQEARRQLAGIADVFLIHDRAIARPMDDSVVRMSRSGPIVLRRARGLVPRTIRLPESVACHVEGPVLAVGGHLKNTVALLDGDRILLSQHLGDLSTLETEYAVRQAIDDLQWLLRVKPYAVACDLHPDYRSTRLAEEMAGRWDIPLVRVQHHHAHVVACMAERGVTGEVLGVAWDGAGYGEDGSLWGGEFLLTTYRESQRVAHLHPFRLPGGEQAAREPRRAALAVRWETFGAQGCLAGVEEGTEWGEQAQLLVAMLAKQIQSPVTTSMGRLFDAVASMLGLCQVASFEGQAAMVVEQEGIRASVSVHGEGDTYPIPLITRDEAPRRWIADWRPMIELMADDLRHGIERSRIAHRFHHSLAELIGQVAERVGVRQVVLTGGCFQNVLLADLARVRLESAGFVVLTHREVPPNDGGLALGQAVIAATQLRTGC
ncbi:MAG: carbamoyltransferase HypF [Nitrospiraceae bacterium]|nr:MAG: carbamoyltransferase HypF [Nitrospiraceae bacterium]